MHLPSFDALSQFFGHFLTRRMNQDIFNFNCLHSSKTRLIIDIALKVKSRRSKMFAQLFVISLFKTERLILNG